MWFLYSQEIRIIIVLVRSSRKRASLLKDFQIKNIQLFLVGVAFYPVLETASYPLCLVPLVCLVPLTVDIFECNSVSVLGVSPQHSQLCPLSAFIIDKIRYT